MSNHLAIATVTKALAQILDEEVKTVVDSASVDTQRPDGKETGARVHLFLYQVTPNAALRNSDLPTRDASGRVTNRPTTALDLHYLLTFYGDEKKLEPQRMLGGAVRRLLAEPGLTRERILNVSHDDGGDKMDGSNLANAVEQVKFTPSPLSLEELSRIWSIFYQTPYALSVAYSASAVLIESEEPARAALPVLKRGEQDQGVDTALGPFPSLESLHIGEGDDDVARFRQQSYPSAKLGTILTLRGQNLGGEAFAVRFTNPRLPLPESVLDVSAALTVGRKDEIKLSIPNPLADQTKWAAGIYSVAVLVTRGGRQRSTNSLPLSFAPQIQNIATGVRDLDGNVLVTVTANPAVRLTQPASLVLPDREVAAEIRASQGDPLEFLVPNPANGKVNVRLRVDGVDSLQFKRDPGPPSQLVLDSQSVTFPP